MYLGLLSLLAHRRDIIASQEKLVEIHEFALEALENSDARLNDLTAQIRQSARDPRILVHLLRQADPEGFQYTQDHINCLIVSLGWPTDQFNSADYEVRMVDGRLTVVSLVDGSVLSSKSSPLVLSSRLY
jgi:hypothetical protein